MADLKLFNIRERCTALSPVPSTVFYAEGCNFRCKGCLYWEAHDKQEVFTVSTDDAAAIFLRSGSVCMVFSGGNPVIQAEAFAELVRKVRSVRDCGLIIYCGETQEELRGLASADPDVKYLADSADIIITGRYMPEFDSGHPMVGSTNQVVDFRTPRYEKYRDMYEQGARRIEIEISYSSGRQGITYSGVPTDIQRRFFYRLADAIVNGCSAGTADDAETYQLTDKEFTIGRNDRTVAYVVIGESGIDIRLNDISEDDSGPLVGEILRLRDGVM